MTSVVTVKNPQDLDREIAKRRTFAIISHPDAGKTTLTEKLLLYGGAVQLAGAVRARKTQRHATSDWMQMEQERGISITSAVIQFPYKDHLINLLDTPGHQDFSEDTYRTLMAADSAVMVLDGARGIEAQTEALFHVCRQRGIPIFTFINKMDRYARDPLALLDEIEAELGLKPVPFNWPIGNGDTFAGVYDRQTNRVHLFEKGERGHKATELDVTDYRDPRIQEISDQRAFERLQEDVELLDIAGPSFDMEAFRAGTLTPVFFGSALTNFGVELFFDSFVELAPAPATYCANTGPVPPEHDDFSAFVFKIQSNMNPRHRDSVAFVRICSGVFERDMTVYHPRLDEEVRLSYPHRFFAAERETVDRAYPGDVIGLVSRGTYAIGDTICTGQPLEFDPIPRFAPEQFALLRNTDTWRYKQFNQGLDQLEAEGAIQVLFTPESQRREVILGAVGRLQFDVVQFRLEQEYDVETQLEMLPFQTARIVDAPDDAISNISWGMSKHTVDRDGQVVALFPSEYTVRHWRDRYGDIELHTIGSDIGQRRSA